MPYKPSYKIIDKYADVLVNFALRGGKGIKKGDIVRVSCGEFAEPLYIAINRAILKAGGHVIHNYYPNDDRRAFNPARDFYEFADDFQLKFFPKEYLKALANTIDHNITIISDVDKEALKGIDPKKMMMRGEVMQPFRKWLDKRENQGKFSWTVAMYGTPAGAKEAGMSEKEYWGQIIKGCFLDKKDPKKEWRSVLGKIDKFTKKLDALKIDKLHIKGRDVDLWIKIGEKRRWKSGSGANIPSFEIYTSPDWRGTEGWIRFNQPLYRYGNLIKGIELSFKNGRVVKASAKKNEKVLKEMIATKNADKVGEFSLTDKRFSRITKFMAETLFDENMGGPYGNTHIALGDSYQDCFRGDSSKLKTSGWKKLGFNSSSVHTDVISTTDRTVTAFTKSGKKKVIYKSGQFVI